MGPQRKPDGCTRLLLLRHLREVELELRTLEDIAVTAAGLARARRDLGVEAASVELRLELLGEHTGGLALIDLALDMVRDAALLILGGPLADLDTIELLVPLLEGGSIDLDDAALHEGVGAHQLVVGRVVGNVQQTGLAGDGLSAPRVIPGVEAQSTVLGVATTGTHGANALVADPAVGGLTTELELAVHAPFSELATC